MDGGAGGAVRGAPPYLEDDGDLILESLRRERGLSGRALLVDCGLTEEGRKLARLLAGKYRWVILCGREEAADFLTG